MHPQQSTGVPPGGPRFAPEARRVGGIGERQLPAVHDLIAMQVRDGHLGGRDEEEIVGRRLVRRVLGIWNTAPALAPLALHDERRAHFLLTVVLRVYVRAEICS